MTSFDTLAAHAGREDLVHLGVHALPLDLSSTYPLAHPDADALSLESLAGGGPPTASAVYARLFNPTVARFERGLAALEGAEEAVAFASGMAALTACLMAARERGDHVVAVRPLYGGSDHLLASGMLGMKVDFVDAGAVGSAVREETALVIVETPANPTLGLVDIGRVVREARGAPVLVDNTFATPVLQRPIAHGAAAALHSATKYLGGHGDVLGGVVATNASFAAALRRVRVATGAVLHPLAGYLLHRGLATLPLRVRASQEGARVLARRLAAHHAVRRVFYPELPGGDPRGVLGRQMAGGGGILSFEVADAATAARVLSHVRLMTPAVSLGSTDTLIQAPAAFTHRVVDPRVREATAIAEGMLRVAVGVEDPEDLWADLAEALAAAEAVDSDVRGRGVMAAAV